MCFLFLFLCVATAVHLSVVVSCYCILPVCWHLWPVCYIDEFIDSVYVYPCTCGWKWPEARHDPWTRQARHDIPTILHYVDLTSILLNNLLNISAKGFQPTSIYTDPNSPTTYPILHQSTNQPNPNQKEWQQSQQATQGPSPNPTPTAKLPPTRKTKGSITQSNPTPSFSPQAKQL